MREKAASTSFLAFSTIPTTVVFVVFYAVLFVTLVLTDDITAIPEPSKQRGVNFDQAYADLHHIGNLPHPYNSHQNEIVRDYLLSRAHGIARRGDFIHVEDDRTSNITISLAINTNNTRYATYFEGLNVLVKIDGTMPELPGILFNAHYDTVPTSPGATDDGIGTLTLIQLMEHFSRNRPKRTVVFNMNNGEEEGLNGAISYLEHPWSKLTDTFLNVDSGGVGGRPFLLRTSSTRLAKAFGKASYPHGLITFADAFNFGVVKSASDFTVYAMAGLGGIDYVTYRGRDRYHTMGDDIPSFDKFSLYQMMESSVQIGEALANDEDPTTGDAEAPLYFDLFSKIFVVTSVDTFFVINLLLLLVGPLLVVGLSYGAHRRGTFYRGRVGWGRAPIAFVVSIVVTMSFGKLYARSRPFAVYSAPVSVLVSIITLSFLCYRITLRAFAYFRPVPQQRAIALLESFVFWWIMLAIDTALIGGVKLGGLYFFTFFYAGNLAALVLGLPVHVELPVTLPSKEGSKTINDVDGGVNASESTPLLSKNQVLLEGKDAGEDNQAGIWFIQFLLAVPFPVILASQLAVVFMYSLQQSLTDGGSANTVYLGTAFFAVLIFMPTMPFVHKLHRRVTIAVAAIFICTTVYNFTSFPFSSSHPFRVFFQQIINLDTGVNEVMLTGVEPWISRYVMPEMPSSWGEDARLSCDGLDTDFRAVLPYCSWHGLPPTVAPGETRDWVTVNTQKEAPGKGRISIYAPTSRGCRLYFDHDTPVMNMHVHGGSERVIPGFTLPEEGLWEARLWSRTWNRTFDVSVAWADGERPLKGRVSCLWHERAGVPAFDEIMAYLPNWVLPSTRGAGLLEGWKEFEVS